MRAAVITSLDGPGAVRVRDVPEPRPAAGQVVVDVRYAGVTFPDVLQTRGEYQLRPELPVVPDMVDVFRRESELPSVLRDAIAVGAKTLWLQQGLWDEQIARDGVAAGLQVVMDRCLKVDYARLL